MIWGETLPSGRERAIETLVDMDPEGSFYRAARVLEESVPQTLSQRPNLVTKSALVEEAYALSKYDLDQLAKYDEVFGEQQNASFSGHLVAMGKDQKDRILRHHAKIMTAKRGMGGKASLSPSPQLVAALKRLVYGEEGGDSSLLRSLLRSVMDHPAFAKDGDDKQPSSQVDDKSQQQQHELSHQLESLIANICENDTSANNKSHRLHGLLIAILSIVTGHDVNKNPDELKSPVEETDPTVVPPLQVGSLLSVVMPEEDDKNPWSLDPELLSFLGQAAGTYEERIEIQKARLMARLDSTKKEAPPETPSDSQIATSTSPPPPPRQQHDSNLETPSAEPSSTPQPAETPQPASTPDAYAIPEDVNSAAAALSAAVFEQIISAATGEETSSNEDGGRESSGSDSDHDSDYEESERRGLENEESSSSSSSSSSSEADPGEESNQQEQEQQQRETQQQPDMDSEDDDDDMVLRQALALSLVEQSQALRVDTAMSTEDTDDVAAPPSSLSSCPVTPGNNTPQSVRESGGEPETESSPLPAMPTAPHVYPYTDLLVGEKGSDSDEMERDSKYFDPAALKHFGSLPSTHVLVYLLRYTLEMVERRKFHAKDESPVSAQNVKVASTVSGGIGDTLFPPFLKTQKTTDHTGKEIGTSLQLLVSLFVLVVDRRIDAIDNLKKSILQEEKSSDSDSNNRASDTHGSAEEGDDPAIALARNLYLAESSSESKESLEAKGMHRKAAAAAHDAAALLESRRRRTESWMQRVKLLSHATLLSMKCLKTFLQWIVRRWIQERHGTSPVDCHELLPTALISKLSICLASLSSISTFQSLATVLASRDEEGEEIFMSTRLYQDSLLLWGETVPIVYPSPKAQIEVLRSLLSECSKAQIGSHKRPLEAISSVPESDMEPHFHRLQMLCRRLRVCDLLENLVSCPACYVQETDSDAEAESPITEIFKEPSRATSIVSLIASNSKLLGGMTGELRNLYLSLCHGCNVRILLWDGIFACTEMETDEAVAALTPSPGSIRVGSTPSSSLLFDSTKCSDSMAIITSQDGSTSSGGSSVHQRASKVWGTVLSSCCFMPKTGVHRWAVKLDKCERGHVFVGVATAQASMRTYVGGDKFGWGMIGTQALWHDRRKVRGDYGATFRTGSTIIVTLDTDAGTLSFSSWRDSNSSNSFSLDSLVQNLSSPRRHGNNGGSAEEWGVAFEGLPLDSKLYPAVGLYQRDDKVTLLTVESGPRSSNRDNAVDLSGGSCYYPRLAIVTNTDQPVNSQLKYVRDFNDLLSQDGINFATNTLNHIMEQLSSDSDNDFLWTRVLPSLASSLCLVPPNVPVLSTRFALALLPQLTKCIKKLETIGGSDRPTDHSLFRTNMQEGKWIIRATGSAGSGSGSEEYIVDFSSAKNEDGKIIGFEGSGVGTTGKSKNGLVAILGTLKGSSIHFVEEWTDGNDESFLSRSSEESASSCVVSARLSLDGTKFEGTYRNVQFGTTGQIAGFFSSDVKNVASFRLKDAPPASSGNRSEFVSSVVAGEALLCLAHSHLSTIVVEDAAGDQSLFEPQRPDQSSLASAELKIRQAEVKKCLSYPILSKVSESSRQTDFQALSEFVNTFYGLPSHLNKDHAPDCNLPLVTEEFVLDCVNQEVTETGPLCCPDDLEAKVANVDGKIAFKGSFASLCTDDYHRTRRSIICVMVFRCGLLDKLNRFIDEKETAGELESVWKLAVKMLEDGVRHALSREDSIGNREKARDACILNEKICSFLKELSPHGEPIDIDTAANDLSRLFAAVSTDSDIAVLKSEMARSSKRAFIRAIPYHEIFTLLDTNGGHGIESQVSIESLAIGIPRLLGRGVVESTSKDVLSKDRNLDLGGHYLSNLRGLSSTMLSLLTNSVHRVLKALSEIAERAVSIRIDELVTVDSQVTTDSMMLSLLACFCLVLQQQDVEFLVFKTEVLSVIKEALEHHRSSFEQKSLNSDGSSKASVVRDLHEISEREYSRAVLRASLAAAHVTTFQVLRIKGANGEIAARRCLDLVLGELDAMLPFADKEKGDANDSYIQKQQNTIWDKWTDLLIGQKHPKAPSTSRAGDTRSPVGKSGLTYLEENGMLQVSGAHHSSPQKPSSRSRGSPASSQYSTETSGKQPGSFCHQFLSHWLHIVVSITKVPLSRSIVANDSQWMKSLFNCIGYEIEFSEQGVITPLVSLEPSVSLPGRYKSRILRILCPLLQSRESSESVVEILFHLAGSASFLFTDFQNDDEGIVSREAVSLLRHMHSSANASWRSCIDNVIFHTIESQVGDRDSLKKKAGVLCFLNGGIDMINRGSYVLLKPAAAVPLSVDQQSSPSSKSHSSSSSGSGGSGVSSTPHHVVGNGTESIVAGLCRSDASAGIVSSIDMKNGVCEVVLLDRKFLNQQGSSDGTVQSTFRSRPAGALPKGGQGSRHTLTVRALRSPLSDVVQAQEVPLLVDGCERIGETLIGLLGDSVNLLSNARNDNTQFETLESKVEDADDVGSPSKSVVDKSGEEYEAKRDDVMRTAFAAMVVRSSISILSDEQTLASFLKNPRSKDVLSGVLRLAYPESASSNEGIDLLKGVQKKFLSSLALHEARCAHLFSLSHKLSSMLVDIGDTNSSQWGQRVADFKKRNDELEAAKSQPLESEKAAGTKTPPPSSKVPDTPPVLTSAGTSSESATSSSRNNENSSNRAVSQSTAGSENSEEDDDSEAAATAAAHLREAAIAQMAELGLPRSWSELALRRTGGTNIEAAVHFCLERGGEMERLLAEERERERMMQRQSSGGSSSRRRSNRGDVGSNHLLRQLLEMGFPSRWCAEALTATGNNVDEALTWILTNGERLSAEDEGMEDGEDEDLDDDDDDDEEDEESQDEDSVEVLSEGGAEGQSTGREKDKDDDAATATTDSKSSPSSDIQGWSGSVIPLRFISGRSIIDPRTLAISGLPTGGFSSVGTKGVLLTSGKWYYEAILETAGCLQIGWADGSFAGHCHADRGDGCGDGPSSWAYDGWRRYRWHSTATEWGCRWKEGDVVGCMVDMDNHVVSFTLNGRAEEVGMGVAFSGEGFRPCGGVYACVSFNRREKLKLILGGSTSEPFKYPPPDGYLGVGEAVLRAVEERDLLIEKESLLDLHYNREETPLDTSVTSPKGKLSKRRFLCDFSDGEHGHELMAWAHRYYGSDASVHLGSNRMKQSGLTKGSSSSTSLCTSEQCLDRRIEQSWKKLARPQFEDEDSEGKSQLCVAMKKGLLDVGWKMLGQGLVESLTVSSLLARKLVLHVMVTSGSKFEPDWCLSDHDEPRLNCALRFWKIIESSSSLRSAGWVGEAGAMAIAAEALGLGISSNDASHSRQSGGERSGLSSISDLDEAVLLPTGSIVQLLSAVLEFDGDDALRYTGRTLCACAEAAIGSDGGGGVLVFIRKSLEAALCKSEEVRAVFLAAIRRSVRLLAVVEYDSDDSGASENTPVDDDDETDKTLTSTEKSARAAKEVDESDIYSQPDARLVSFLTGLFLTPRMEASVEKHAEIRASLFEAWSVGLLSASLPWRMVCAFTAAGLLNGCPSALEKVVTSSSTLARFYGRLQSTVARRVWAERAAMPVCSRYSQSMVELLCSVKRAMNGASLPDEFMRYWNTPAVDAATPRTISSPPSTADNTYDGYWEAEDGWISSDSGWEIWSGSVECLPVDWKAPSRSAVRTLMDGGDGPPMLREGCVVMRGLDWDFGGTNGDEDGKSQYEAEKAKREAEKESANDDSKDDKQKEKNNTNQSPSSPPVEETSNDDEKNSDPTGEDPAKATDTTASKSDSEPVDSSATPDPSDPASATKKKKKKRPSPKLPLGTVVAIEPWMGIPGMGRRVRWHLTGEEKVYRYGGDGGRYDISHVEVNEKETRVKKRHPLPESAEQCAARHGFGVGRRYSVLLRLRRGTVSRKVDGKDSMNREGVMEWPDFGAGIHVDCAINADGSLTVTEKDLLYGSRDSGWEARFGQPSFVSGTTVSLRSKTSSSITSQSELDTKSPYQSLYEELIGTNAFQVQNLRNREDGSKLTVTSELRLFRGRSSTISSGNVNAPLPPPIEFDRDYHASSLSLSRDGRTVSCVSSDGRGTAFASVGFTKGVHYWEVKLEQADIGSVFIGVAEKPTGSGSGSSYGYDSSPRLNRWHGWGFVNFRATYTAGAERIYGAHCHQGDTVGVLLDCDAGRISFFFDGLKYGEHILNDLGCAFENLSPFGFNVDGCGSGGAGQGAPSGIEGGRSGRYPAQGAVRPRSLWPVIGLRNLGDRVTISSKWNTSYGVDGNVTLKNVLAVDEMLQYYSDCKEISGHLPAAEERSKQSNESDAPKMPDWFLREAFTEYRRWRSKSWCRSTSRGSGPFQLASFGLDFDLDSSPYACASASALLGLSYALQAADRVSLKRSAGRILELAEEAVVLGAYQGRLYYRIVSQKSEGGSLTEGGGRAWCWDESEVVDGLPPVEPVTRVRDIDLPFMDRFRCTSPGGLRIVYGGGAVVRSDLEIFDGSINLGLIPVNTVVPKKDVIERRVNSCGVVRYRVRYESMEGWISSRIRGGKEEAIVAPEPSDDPLEEPSFPTPQSCADKWIKEYEEIFPTDSKEGSDNVGHLDSFASLASKGVIPGMSVADSDAILAQAVGAISDFYEEGSPLDVKYEELLASISFGIAMNKGTEIVQVTGTPGANQVSASMFGSIDQPLPAVDALMARVALLRAFNRRARLALPWLSIRPCQEGGAVLGGICGHGASIDRAGRYWISSSLSQWVQVPSISSKLRSLRGLLFTSVKRNLLQSITTVTTTPTPLAHDEYELPREIRTVRINRLKARRVMSGDDIAAKRKHSVFAQLSNETKGWGGAALRRGFVAKGHGGQKRAFKVKLIGEGVNDYSGPYREAFSDAFAEVLNVDGEGRGSLGVLNPTPNNVAEIGENRDLVMFSANGRDVASICKADPSVSDEELRIRESFFSLTAARDETSREVEEALVFMGRLAGTAFRHGIPLDLPLPLESLWKSIVEEMTSEEKRLKELDTLSYKQRGEDKSRSPQLWWQQRMLNSFVEGLSNVLPVEVLTVFTGSELRDIVCGNPEVDVDLLHRVVEYEGYQESDDVIQFFWETLREFTNDERKKFLQFVWARNRLPMKETDFDAPFKIQRDTSNKNGAEALPSASTCFFSLALPEYSSQEQMKEKLLFAINNVATMETDFQTNSAEIAEGYRAV